MLQSNTNDSGALFSLVQIAIKTGAYQHALPLLKQCVEQLPNEKQPLLQLAQVYAELQLLSESRASFQKLNKCHPSWDVGLFGYAGFLQRVGELEHAQKLLEQTIQVSPKHVGAYLALTGLQKFTEQTTQVDQMKSLLGEFEQAGGNSAQQQMQLHYALGKVMSDLKQYQNAFEHWLKANAFQLSNCQFRVAQMKPFLTQVKVAFESTEIRQANARSRDMVTPIFIVGLPRTGSTLLEQMLCAHSEIESVGEVNYVAELIAAGAQKFSGKHYPLELERLTTAHWQKLGADYLQQLQKHHSNCRFIINKLPANFQSIGVIKKALPNAVIVHLTRDVRAVALSIFKNYFLANEPYFCDLNEFSQYYALYQTMMTFWNGIYADSIHELEYENLVSDPKTQLETIFERCKLDWQPECLEFHNNKNNVSTLSDTQVRRPVYHSSVAEWQHYSEFLDPYLVASER